MKDVTGLFLICKGKEFQRTGAIVTERIQSVCLICELCGQRWGCDGT